MNNALLVLLGLGVGCVLGAVIGWLAAWRKAATSPPDQRLEAELRTRLEQQEAELTGLRSALTGSETARATAEAGRVAAEKSLTAQRTVHEQALQEAKALQERALLELRETFKALSADALKQTQPDFLRLANETLAKFQESAKGDLSQRQQAIATLVKPLEEQLKTYQQRLQQSETTQASALGEVKKHLESLAQQSSVLSAETVQLRRVLSSNQARGRWCEETLRRVVEAAGMSAHCDFAEQTVSGDGKPDLIVRLPGERVIVVDAKVPDLDFLESDVADPARRAEALASHAAKLKFTIKNLAERDYPTQFSNALDYVVLFLPAESLFSAALEGDRDLILWAASKRILLTTPASLIALLRSVSVSWQHYSQSENARAIAKAAQELYARVSTFTAHFGKIRAGLEKANEAFNDAVGSYERMIRPSGEKLTRLASDTTAREIPEIEPLQSSLRPAPLTVTTSSN